MKITEEGRLLKVGVIGLGCRSISQLKVLCGMADVEIAAVCDVYEDRVQK